MSGIGDGFQNYRNGRQVTPQRSSSGDQEHANEPVNQPANDPVNEPVDGPANQPANEDIGGLRGYMVDLYLALRDIGRRLDALIASVLNQYDDYLYDYNYNNVNIRNINVRDNNANADNNVNIQNINVRDNNANVDNNVNIQNVNVRDNNANVDNNEQHEDHNAVVVGGIENEDSDEAFEDCEDVHQYIPEEDPQPGVSRRRSREMDEEDVEPNKRIRWSEEFSDDDSEFFSASDTDSVGCPHAGNIADEDINQQVTEEEPQPGGSTKRSREEDVDEEGRNSKKSRLAHSDSGTSSAVYDHSESSSDELFEDAHEELDNHEAGGSRKRSREDFEEEEECLPVCKFRRCSNESTSSSDED